MQTWDRIGSLDWHLSGHADRWLAYRLGVVQVGALQLPNEDQEQVPITSEQHKLVLVVSGSNFTINLDATKTSVNKTRYTPIVAVISFGKGTKRSTKLRAVRVNMYTATVVAQKSESSSDSDSG